MILPLLLSLPGDTGIQVYAGADELANIDAELHTIGPDPGPP